MTIVLHQNVLTIHCNIAIGSDGLKKDSSSIMEFSTNPKHIICINIVIHVHSLLLDTV